MTRYFKIVASFSWTAYKTWLLQELNSDRKTFHSNVAEHENPKALIDCIAHVKGVLIENESDPTAVAFYHPIY